MLHKLIQLVHIYVGEKLAREVTDWYSLSLRISTLSLSLSRKARRVTLYNFSHKPPRIRIDYPFFENTEQNVVVNGVKKLPYITLQCETSAGATLTHGTECAREILHSLMRTLADPARKRSRDESRLKNSRSTFFSNASTSGRFRLSRLQIYHASNKFSGEIINLYIFLYIFIW